MPKTVASRFREPSRARNAKGGRAELPHVGKTRLGSRETSSSTLKAILKARSTSIREVAEMLRFARPDEVFPRRRHSRGRPRRHGASPLRRLSVWPSTPKVARGNDSGPLSATSLASLTPTPWLTAPPAESPWPRVRPGGEAARQRHMLILRKQIHRRRRVHRCASPVPSRLRQPAQSPRVPRKRKQLCQST